MADFYWYGGSGDLSDPNNWSGPYIIGPDGEIIPLPITAADNAFIDGGGSLTGGIFVANAYISGSFDLYGFIGGELVEVDGSLSIQSGGNVNGYVVVNGLLSVDGGSVLSRAFDDNGTVILNSGSWTSLGYNEDIGSEGFGLGVDPGDGNGTFTQNGGTNSIFGALTVGFGQFASGQYILNGGQLGATLEGIGWFGTGSFTQTGGTNTVGLGGDSSGLSLGVESSGDGSYALEGNASLSANIETIGDQGTGSFTQSDVSTNNTGGLTVGNSAGGYGSYDLESGSLSVGSFNEGIGGYGQGWFIQNGGTNGITGGGLIVGFGQSGNGQYFLNGGQLSATFEGIGWFGTGSFTQTGGTNTVGPAGGGLSLGLEASGDGTYLLEADAGLSANIETIGDQGTGSFTQSDVSTNNTGGLTVGNSAGGYGSYDLESGNLSVGSFNEAIGGYGQGSFIQNGGSNSVTGELLLAFGSGGEGSYDLNAGNLSANSETIGNDGTGNFSQSDGSNAVVGNVDIGSASDGSGNYELDGGTLSAARLIVGDDGQGSFNQDGGTAVVNYFFIGDQAGGTGHATVSGSGVVLTATDPTSGIADQIGFAGTGTLDVSNGAQVNSMVSLVVANQPGSSGTLSVETGGTVTSSKFTLGGGFTQGGTALVSASSGGVITAQNSVFMYPDTTIDVTGGGSFDVGAVTPAAGVVKVGKTGALTGAGLISGTVIVNGGALSVRGGTLQINGKLGDNGSVSVEGDSAIGLHVVGDVALGFNAGTSGTFNLDTGPGNAATSNITGQLVIGEVGIGSFTQRGGSNTVGGTVTIGTGGSSSGLYNLAGGTLTAPVIQINRNGTFQFNGGTVAFSTLNVTGGKMTASADEVLDTSGDPYTTYTVNQTGGGDFVTGSLAVGANSGISGTYNLGGSGKISVGDNLTVGGQSGSSGTFNYDINPGDAATLSIGGVLIVGSSGVGIFNQRGGTLNAIVDIGGAGGSVGTYNLGGTGALNAAGTVVLGSQIGSSGTFNFNTNFGDSATMNVSGSITVGASGIGVFNQGGGTLDATLDLGTSAGGNGTYNLSGGTLNDDLIVGDAGNGTFNNSGGTHNVAGNLILGNQASGNGTYHLSGAGDLSVTRTETVGNSGTGTFTQDGGTNTVGGNLTLGGADGGQGEYQLNDGTLSVNGDEQIGALVSASTGTFSQDGGTNTLTNNGGLDVDSVAGSPGISSYDLKAGQLSSNFEQIGGDGKAEFTQSGGTNTIAGPLGFLVLGLGQNSNGTYELNNGSLSVSGTETVGNSGTGTFTQDGGTNTVGGNLTLGGADGGQGEYQLNDGTLSVNGDEQVGALISASTGTFFQDGGTNTLTNNGGLDVDSVAGSPGISSYDLKAGRLSSNFEQIGGDGKAEFTQSGGTNTIAGPLGFLVLGLGQNSNGTYELNNGSLSVSGTETVGNSGTGTFTQDGGTNTVGGALIVAANAGSIGKYDLQGGTLKAATLQINAGGTLADQTAGQAQIAGAAVDGGVLQMAGGNFQADSLAITATGVMPGFGTITARVDNAGTITATADPLTIKGGLEGTGLVFIGDGGTLDLQGPVNENITFAGGAGTSLVLHPQSYALDGVIGGLALGDIIDLVDTNVTSAIINGSDLTVTENGGQTLNYQVAGALSGNEFALQSDGAGGTDLVLSPMPAVTINGSPVENQTVFATVTLGGVPISPPDITYVWQVSHNGGPWNTSYVNSTGDDTYDPIETDEGGLLRVQVKFSAGGAVYSGVSEATGPVGEDPNEVPTVSISGLAVDGQQLTATIIDNNLIAGDFNSATANYSWQVTFNGGATWTTVQSGAARTYTVTEQDEGGQLRVVGSFIDAAQNKETGTSTATSVVRDPPPRLSVSISGNAVEGATLTATPTLGTDGDNLIADVTYQWLSNGAPITGATGASYVIGESVENTVISVVASFTDDTDQSVMATSNSIGPVLDVPPVLMAPKIGGNPVEGSTLTASAVLTTDEIGATPKYQWQSSANGSTGWSNIGIGPTYTLKEADENNFIRVMASFTDDTGQTVSQISGVSARVVDVPPKLTVPTIAGSFVEGATLTASATLTTDETGLAPTYQWQSSANGSTGWTIIGAGSTYALKEADENNFIRVVASFTDDTGQAVTQNSAASATKVVDVAPTVTVPVISGNLIEGSTLRASSTVTTDESGAAPTYQWQSSANGITGWTPIGTGSTYTLKEVDENNFIRVTASFTDDTAQTVTQTSAVTTAVKDMTSTLTIASNSLSVTPNGSVTMGISVTQDADLTVTISGLNGKQSITARDGGGTVSHKGNVYTWTFTAADVGSGLTLNWDKTKQEVLTVSIFDSDGIVQNSPQTITVTDPPATTTQPNTSTQTVAGPSVNASDSGLLWTSTPDASATLPVSPSLSSTGGGPNWAANIVWADQVANLLAGGGSTGLHLTGGLPDPTMTRAVFASL
jgi:T5SS/PEP-CTERM-associated repeat protein